MTGWKEEDLPHFKQGDIGENPDNPTVLVLTAAERGGAARVLFNEALTESFPRDFKGWVEHSEGLGGSMVLTEW